jgi:gluconolactonase
MIWSILLWWLTPTYVGTVEKFDPEFDQVWNGDSTAIVLAEGFKWTEGPLWVRNRLLFSDIPNNTVYQWTEKEGISVYLTPSGFSGKDSKSREPGSNGLLLDLDSNLVLCQHGDRQMAKMLSPINRPEPKYQSLASHYQGKRFSSPNDAVYTRSGDLYFTDPPYGLPTQNDADPGKETTFNGVYRLRPQGQVELMTDTLTRPNGIAFFPDEKSVLVANSDPKHSHWYRYDVVDGKFTNGRIFFSAKTPSPGSPDGLKINKEGYVFASGPGGILVLNSKGKLLGRLRLKEPASNCALSPDQKTLYITNNTRIIKWTLRK